MNGEGKTVWSVARHRSSRLEPTQQQGETVSDYLSNQVGSCAWSRCHRPAEVLRGWAEQKGESWGPYKSERPVQGAASSMCVMRTVEARTLESLCLPYYKGAAEPACEHMVPLRGIIYMATMMSFKCLTHHNLRTFTCGSCRWTAVTSLKGHNCQDYYGLCML